MKCTILTGVPYSAQEAEHPNGTRMLTGGGGHAFTIATHVFVPNDVEAAGEDSIAAWIKMQIETGAADFKIVVGRNDEIDC
jgi:hypothetical protein